MAEVEIRREDTGSKARYVATVEGIEGEGELTLSILSQTQVIADHTGVPDAMRGMGIGQALVERLVADARTGGWTIVPLCPFVKSQYQRHPEWSDVMRG